MATRQPSVKNKIFRLLTILIFFHLGSLGLGAGACVYMGMKTEKPFGGSCPSMMDSLQTASETYVAVVLALLAVPSGDP